MQVQSEQVVWQLDLLARTLALVVVPLTAMFYVILRLVSNHYWLYVFEWEGPIEWATVLLLLLSAVILIRTAYVATSNAPVRVFAMCAAAASIFVSGEELSWGQRIFELQTPGWWRAINSQGELTLHNLHSVQRYRHWPLLLVGLSGVVLVLLSRYSEVVRQKLWFSELLPPRFLIWTFVLMIVAFILHEWYWQWPDALGQFKEFAHRSEELGEFRLAASACAYSANLLARRQ